MNTRLLFVLAHGLLLASCLAPGDRYYEPTRRGLSGAGTGALVGAAFDGSRGARAGALVGGLLGVASTPAPQRTYHPRSVPSSQLGYVHR